MEQITTKNAGFNINVKALETGEGFVIQFIGSVQFDDKNAIRTADRVGLSGNRRSAHETLFADVRTLLDAEINTFGSDLTDFVSLWNTEASGGGDIEAFVTAYNSRV